MTATIENGSDSRSDSGDSDEAMDSGSDDDETYVGMICIQIFFYP